MNERGTALIATLSVALILLPLGAFVVLQCRTDLLIQHNLRAELETFYVAEAGLEHALAEIGPGFTFEPFLDGPDHIAGTADDGVFPFSEGAVSDFPWTPFRYDVRTSAELGMLRVTSSGSGVSGASKVVSALVARSQDVFTPAACHLGGDLGRVNVSGGPFLVSGFDHRPTDDPAADGGPAPPLPALTGARGEAALRTRLSEQTAQQLVGAGGTPSLATTPSLDVDAYVRNADTYAGHVRLFAATLPGDIVLGTQTSPQVSTVVGDVNVGGTLSGSGILVVQGTLHVTGTLNFTGLLIAQGGIVFEPSSTVTVAGAIWLGPSEDIPVDLLGGGSVAFSSSILADVDRAFTGLLPHAAIVVGWQEQL